MRHDDGDSRLAKGGTRAQCPQSARERRTEALTQPPINDFLLTKKGHSWP
jgi:hypothetical protein